MKKQGKIIIVIIFLLIIGYQLYERNQVKEFKLDHKKLYSESAILLNIDGNKIASKSSNEKIKPASLTKIMTAIIGIEHTQNIDNLVFVDDESTEYLHSLGASTADFTANTFVSERDLLYGLLLPSGADAAVYLAKNTSGTEEEFVKLMNKKAKQIGMLNTHFVNPYGTDDSNQYSTVTDLSKLLIYSLKNNLFRKVFTSKYYKTEGYFFSNSTFEKFGNPILKNGQLLGGKTGYTDEAGLCLASLAEVGGKEYVLVTVGAKGSHNTKQYNMIDARNIYEAIEG